MRTKHLAAVVLSGVLLAGTAMAAVAAGNGEMQEQTVLLGSKLTLSQAIATAERQTGGMAYDAGVDVEHGKPRVIVETNGPKGVQTVIVNVQSGEVVGGHAGGEAD